MSRIFALTLLQMSIFSLFSLYAETTLLCHEPEKTGLYEQCEEIAVLDATGLRVRVYSKTKQKVYLVDRREIFRASKLDLHSTVRPGTQFTIQAEDLWTNSKAGFLSICQVDKEIPNHLLEVSCGRYQKEKIAKDSVYEIHPYFGQKIVSESTAPQRQN